ncbi:MAG TPA: Uma2 family endonuclease [Pirellulales bacterium]|nr:Uma2 family endonuclease [Pirellulales bacterium]
MNRSKWIEVYSVSRRARDKIAAAFGAGALRYDPRTETLSFPSRMRDVTWEQYDALLKALPDHRLRHSYDRGSLEMMSPSQKHDKLKTIIGRFIEQTTLSLGIPLECFGSATYRRKALRRGLEPDETYYIANAPAMQGRFDFDPRRDPPPDLVVEVDLRRPSSRRMRIYAALGVLEVWKYEAQGMRFCALGADGKYDEVTQSLSFPFITPADLDRFLARLSEEPMNDVVLAFGKWAKAEHKKLTRRKRRTKKSP